MLNSLRQSLDMVSKSSSNQKKKKNLNKFSHKSKKGKPDAIPGPGHYDLDDNTIQRNMDEGRVGPRFAPNIASQLLLDEGNSEEDVQPAYQIKISDNLKIELEQNSSQLEV